MSTRVISFLVHREERHLVLFCKTDENCTPEYSTVEFSTEAEDVVPEMEQRWKDTAGYDGQPLNTWVKLCEIDGDERTVVYAGVLGKQYYGPYSPTWKPPIPNWQVLNPPPDKCTDTVLLGLAFLRLYLADKSVRFKLTVNHV